ncbi:MAG TPA: sialate O-acetylesterase, partial [Ferruginibacter sp.]|nr:sialate O-acetylesterase [Ferruginibacter sp.]
GYWQDQGLKDIEAGVVWFKKEINIPASWTGKPAVLQLGSISLKDVTYVNGKKVGSSNNKYVMRKYDIAPGLLKEGKNIITVRVLSETGNAGFLKDKMYQLVSGNDVINLSGDWLYKPAVSTKPLLRNDVTRFQDQASSMYHGMLEPLIGYGIKGVIWYQGESNVSRANEYHTIFSRLITTWRAAWQQGNFPFLFVQLANINPPKNEPGESKLAALQEAQQQTLSLPNTGMAVANDIGEWNDVHPLNKLDVGKRLALAAQKVAYGNKKVVYSGPTYQYLKKKNHRIELYFSNTGSGMFAKGGGDLKYFSIADSSNNFVWAKALISGKKIIVWSDSISNPVAVRYAWADNPQGANLYNKEGLPASCFRTDQK